MPHRADEWKWIRDHPGASRADLAQRRKELRNGCPRWLHQIAAQVEDLVSDPRNRGRFEEMAVQWLRYVESKKHRYIAARDGRPIVSFLPKDSTLKDKYATLAALHDELRPDSKKMFPLRVRRRFKNRRFRARRLIAGMSYQALCKSVLFVEADLPDARSVIQAAFQAVERDLARPRGIPQAVGGSGRRSPNVTHAKADGPGVKRRSPRAKLTKRQKEVANKVAECKDNQTEAAKKLGVKPATVRKTMWAVRKKTKTADSTPSQSVRARTLPQDNRGQANLSDRNDE